MLRRAWPPAGAICSSCARTTGTTALTPLVLVMGEIAGRVPLGSLIWQRGVETFIGVVVAVVVAVVIARRNVTAPK